MKNTVKNNLIVGNKIPRNYFVTKGTGESDIHIHSGSFHLALKNANIEKYNIITYSSILPKQAVEIKKPKNLVYGSVMETIMAIANSKKGKRATAGIIFGMLYNKKTNKKYGGLVCEQNSSFLVRGMEKSLRKSLNELYENGFSNEFYLKDIKIITESFIPKKKYGTALVALCFTDYIIPILK